MWYDGRFLPERIFLGWDSVSSRSSSLAMSFSISLNEPVLYSILLYVYIYILHIYLPWPVPKMHGWYFPSSSNVPSSSQTWLAGNDFASWKGFPFAMLPEGTLGKININGFSFGRWFWNGGCSTSMLATRGFASQFVHWKFSIYRWCLMIFQF